MKKLMRIAQILALAGGAVGFLLRIWFLAIGPDKKGLYPTDHISWILVCVLSVLVLAAIWVLSYLADSGRGKQNQCPTPFYSVAGWLVAGIAMALYSIGILMTPGWLNTLTGLLCLASGLVLILDTGLRLADQKIPIAPHMLPCFFFAMQLFRLGQIFGSEPEMCRYLFRFLADFAMIPACYWLWSFDVELGFCQKRLQWTMIALYCNLVAMASSGQWLFRACIVLWLLSSMPDLRYRPQRLRHVPEPAEQPAAVPAAPEDVVPQVADHKPAVADIEPILEQILKEFGAESQS